MVNIPVVPGIIPACNVCKTGLSRAKFLRSFHHRNRFPHSVPQSSIILSVCTIPNNNNKQSEDVGTRKILALVGMDLDIKLGKEQLSKIEQPNVDISAVNIISARNDSLKSESSTS